MGSGRALARAALAGNPSDLYGGAVLGITIADLPVHVELDFGEGGASAEGLAPELVDATLSRFGRDFPDATDHGARLANATVSVETEIPRSVGLGGSSAIVIGLLRALCAEFSTSLAPDALAELALSIERDDLGTAAGLQDRVIQAYEGVVFMDFAAGRYERLQPEGLPPLLLAWRAQAAAPSGPVHNALMQRWRFGEEVVHRSIAELTDLGIGAREAVIAGDIDALRRCVDGSYDARARMMSLDPAHVEMVMIARAAGAAANYTGSGGAIVCVCRSDVELRRAEADLRAAGCGTLAVTLDVSVDRRPGP